MNWVLAIVVLLPIAAFGRPANLVFANVSDYGYLWWPDGPAAQVYEIETSRYALWFNVTNLSPVALFPLTHPPPESTALAENSPGSFPPPPVSFACKVVANGVTNTVTSTGANFRDAQLVECGKFFQRRWHKLGLPGGPELNTNQSGLEIAAWPDRVSFVLRIVPAKTITGGVLEMRLGLTNLYHSILTNGAATALQAADDTGFVFLKSRGASSLAVDAANSVVTARTVAGAWQAGEERSVGLIIYPVAGNVRAVLSEAVAAETAPLALATAEVIPARTNLAVAYDADRGWYDISLRNDGPATDNAIVRTHLCVSNTTPAPQVIRLNFDGVPFYIPGLTAVLRDDGLNPLGIPVQLSKNWHNGTADRWIGPWFHGLTMLTVPANTTLNFELAMAGQNWGGLPAATHSQLCVIGYGGNQQWDEAALGNHGEALTYDVDHVLTDNDCADSRPMLTTDGHGHHPAWGENAGGASFLRYVDAAGKAHSHTGMRTRYLRYGPNLAQVTFAGRTDDGAMEFSHSAALFRSDDYTRGWHRFRLQVKADTSFSRLVFFQQASDTYDYNGGATYAFGNARSNTPQRQWQATLDQHNYIGHPVALTGPMPWAATMDAPSEPGYSAANRGFVIRSWQARIAGTKNTPPYLAERSIPGGSILDVVPPPGVTNLKAGDYVEAELVRLYVPKFASNNYGPNINFAAALTNYQNTFNLVLREAVGNNLAVTVQTGALEHLYPLQIRAANNQAAFTITGGLGFAPVTITGLSGYQAPVLQERVGSAWWTINQAVNGNDFWQCDYNAETGTWEITFNIPLDGPNYRNIQALMSAPQKRVFRFHVPAGPKRA